MVVIRIGVEEAEVVEGDVGDTAGVVDLEVVLAVEEPAFVVVPAGEDPAFVVVLAGEEPAFVVVLAGEEPAFVVVLSVPK